MEPYVVFLIVYSLCAGAAVVYGMWRSRVGASLMWFAAVGSVACAAFLLWAGRQL